MTEKKVLPYGRWPSPMTPGNTDSLLEISEVTWSSDGSLLWKEINSSRGSVKMTSWPDGGTKTLSGKLNVGGGLLYGGGSYGIGQNRLAFRDRESGHIYITDLDGETDQILTNSLTLSSSYKFTADGNRLLFIGSDGENDALYLADLNSSQLPYPVEQENDFYNYPRCHPDGERLAWMGWDHPHMPWDSSAIWLGKLEWLPGKQPRMVSKERIAGGEGISVLQPEFSPDGKWLAYLSDQSGWWQIYLFNLDRKTNTQLTSSQSEKALPAWLQDRGAFGFSPDSQRIYYLANNDGFRSVWVVELESKKTTRITPAEEYTWMDWLSVSPIEDLIAVVASSSATPDQLITINPQGETAVILQSSPDHPPTEVFSRPRPVSWLNSAGDWIQGLFYPPHHPEYTGIGQPPLLVIVHSGPTRQKVAEFQPRTQYFTSRGYAVLEVNYRGSSGYGRQYRQSLAGQWGVADVEDTLSGALFVTDQGWADRNSMFLLGSSSGGLTVFQILVEHPGIFRAGVTLYAVVNHLDRLEDAPKFERHYSNWLIGPYPQAEKIYRERSPVYFAQHIQDPVAVFQGGQDPIVPHEQAEQIIEALEKNNLTFQYHFYPDEGHGFKQSKNIADFYQKTEQFLLQYL